MCPRRKTQDARQADYPQQCLFCVPSGHPTCTDHVCVQDRMVGWVIDKLRAGWIPLGNGTFAGQKARQAPGGVDTPDDCRQISDRVPREPANVGELRHDLPTDALTTECQITAQHAIFGALPPHARLSVTMDNGTQDVPPPRNTTTPPQCCTSNLNTAALTPWFHTHDNERRRTAPGGKPLASRLTPT